MTLHGSAVTDMCYRPALTVHALIVP